MEIINTDEEKKEIEYCVGDVTTTDLKGRTIRGGFVSVAAQPIKFLLRTISLAWMARILIPEEFGLVGMVTAVTGVIGLFKDAGLSVVTVQRPTITNDQLSTLFWINMAVGLFLVGLSIAVAPILVSFYREPRLFWVAIALGSGFIFNAAATQHQALLRRQMRYAALMLIDILSLSISVFVGISMAIWGFSYWSLVGMNVILPIANTICVWLAMPWVPGLPRRNIGIQSMLKYGGTVTMRSLVMYLAYNADKVLLGRYWGAEALGIYGRAYQLYNMPLNHLNGAIDGVALPTLSRLQGDSARFRNYFLKGYSMTLALTIPFVLCCAVFAEELIVVLLGVKWKEAAGLLRLLTPTGLAFAFINPFGPLLESRGHVKRSLMMALVVAPVVFAGYVAGLRYGPSGVASGFSAGMMLLIVPLIAWAKWGTSITSKDVIKTIIPPFVAGTVAAAFTLGGKIYFSQSLSPIFILSFGTIVLLASYMWMLLYVMGQKNIYLDVFREIRRRY
jgi:O-antigen/teichoic acid export membrane protein